MKYYEYLVLVKSDLFRYGKGTYFSVFVRRYFDTVGFKYMFWLRTANFLRYSMMFRPLYYFARIKLSILQHKYGICIPYNTKIGEGLYIGHFGGIVVNYKSIIGRNCNINHGVTIGETYGGKFPGTPTLGDSVYVGPGSFIIGEISIGNNVAIGANTVVNKPINEGAVVVSPPGEVISYNGSGNYIVNTDY